jgi:hypothetical protein
MAYTFCTGTAEGEATDTAVYQHGVVASVMYHF